MTPERKAEIRHGLHLWAGEEIGEELLTEIDALAARVLELEGLLKRVTLEEMGGCPDLYAPRGGWDRFQVDAIAALAPTQRDTP